MLVLTRSIGWGSTAQGTGVVTFLGSSHTVLIFIAYLSASRQHLPSPDGESRWHGRHIHGCDCSSFPYQVPAAVLQPQSITPAVFPHSRACNMTQIVVGKLGLALIVQYLMHVFHGNISRKTIPRLSSLLTISSSSKFALRISLVLAELSN